LVVFNNAAKEATIAVPLAGSRIADGVTLQDQLGSAPPVKTAAGIAEFHIPARTVAIYRAQ
jgi:hypothetical protein